MNSIRLINGQISAFPTYLSYSLNTAQKIVDSDLGNAAEAAFNGEARVKRKAGRPVGLLEIPKQFSCGAAIDNR